MTSHTQKHKEHPVFPSDLSRGLGLGSGVTSAVSASLPLAPRPGRALPGKYPPSLWRKHGGGCKEERLALGVSVERGRPRRLEWNSCRTRASRAADFRSTSGRLQAKDARAGEISIRCVSACLARRRNFISLLLINLSEAERRKSGQKCEASGLKHTLRYAFALRAADYSRFTLTLTLKRPFYSLSLC